MQDSTKAILDKIIDKWCNNEVYIMSYIDKNNHEIFTVVKESANSHNKDMKRRLSDRFDQSEDKINDSDLICKITVTKPFAYIHYKSCYSADNDFQGVYKYIERFIAIIKAKIRQMNNLGIQVNLGLISMEEFDKVNDSFTHNKPEIIKQIYEKEEEK